MKKMRIAILALLVMCGWVGAFIPHALAADTVVPQNGWWWNPAEGGRGFTIEQQGNSVFMAGFLYGITGRATWYAAGPSPMNGSVFNSTLTEYSGGQSLTGAYQAPTGNRNAGNISITFTDPSHGTVSWPGGTLPIQRFDFGPGGASATQPAGTAEAGWWWNTGEGGRGFSIEVQNNTMFLGGYMYDNFGNPIWYTSSGPMTNATTYQGAWNEYQNGQTLAGRYEPATVRNANVGTVRVQFSSPTSATLTLPNGRALPLSRFAFAQPSFKPKGVFASTGSRNAVVTGHSAVRGVLIRVKWSDLETSPGSYNYATLDAEIAAAKAAGKQWSFAVAAGSNSPSWLRMPPYNAQAFQAPFRGVPVTIPKFWDPVVQERLHLLAQALAAKYGNDPSLALVYVPQMTSNGIEGHFNGVSSQVLGDAGYTVDRFVGAAKATAKNFARAFANKALAIEVHEILRDASGAERILNDLWTDPDLGQRVGAAVWWLSGRTDYQAALLSVLVAFPGDKYGQLIANSSQLTEFTSGYGAAFTQAKSLKMRYLEPWDNEFRPPSPGSTGPSIGDGTCCINDPLFADFNSWADANFP